MIKKNNGIVPIRIRLRFQDADKPEKITEKECVLFKDEDFLIKCPMRECVKGGFDLRGININNQEQSETFVCSGWQDRERINKHRCQCKLQVQVLV